MHTIGSPEHALLLVKTMQNMFRQLPTPSDTVQGHWRPLDYATWDHRNRVQGTTLFESTDPRDLVHELQLYREPFQVFDARCAEMPGRLPEQQYLQVGFRLFGWDDFLTRISITDMHPRKGCANRLTYEVLDHAFRFEYRPEGSDAFLPYESPGCRRQLVALLANKLADLVSAFAPAVHHRAMAGAKS